MNEDAEVIARKAGMKGWGIFMRKRKRPGRRRKKKQPLGRQRKKRRPGRQRKKKQRRRSRAEQHKDCRTTSSSAAGGR